MTYIPTAVRRKVWERSEGCCELCGRDLRRFAKFRGDMNVGHLDHIKPVSKGGKHTVRNLRLICAKTNLSRGDTDKEWYYNCAEVVG